MSEFDSGNYFNYFTEVEEHFQKARGTSLFLLSTLDWALLEAWKNSGVPLEAVLRGIDRAFEKWRARKQRTQMVNSIAYCAQAVAKEAESMAAGASPKQPASAPFSIEEMRAFLESNAVEVRKAGHEDVAAKLAGLAAQADQYFANLEPLEQILTALEDKLIATERARLSEEELIAARQELDRDLKAYRGKMNAAQLAMLEKQYLDRRLLEHARLPRLSLFYLR